MTILDTGLLIYPNIGKEYIIGLEMFTYVSMLRGINVGGHQSLKMKELVALYESLGFKNVRTYVQSGNVIFNADEADSKRLSNLIENKIKQVFNLPVAVLIRTPGELKQTLKKNPFLKEKSIDTEKLYVTFLAETPPESALNKLNVAQDELDKFVVKNKEIYLYCPEGYGRTKFSNTFFERKLGVTATTRNWKTVTTLSEMAENQPG
jgi:uncharacterized protein (DUF1697 family)